MLEEEDVKENSVGIYNIKVEEEGDNHEDDQELQEETCIEGQKENDLGEEMEQECVVDKEHEEGDEMEEGIDEDDFVEIKIGERYQCRKMDNGDRMKFRILSRAGKVSSKK